MILLISVILWILLLALSWPMATFIVITYPFIWLILLPFRAYGITSDTVCKLIDKILKLPFRIVRAI